MLVVYLVTLNHWVTLLNVIPVAAVSGWMWQPQIFNPLTFLVTLPFRLLPAAAVPLALNIFAAFCGAATLAVLARSVAILPHDRTDMERTRERSDFSFLTGWAAWAPPIAAVLFAGLQLSFWQNATSFTSESLDLLWFAIIVWQLLEFRLDESETRLFVVALMYGAGLTEDWAFIGFFPVFLMMLIWMRRLDFFHPSFLLRMAAYGLGGLLLFLLLPLVAKLSWPDYPFSFWDALRPNLRVNWQAIHLFWNRSDVRHNLALVSLTSLLPAFVMSIRWSSGFGDSSHMGSALVNYMMHAVNAVLLAVLAWVTLGPAFSPHQLLSKIGLTVPGSTFYYISALCIGYYAGYCFLVFGTSPPPSRRHGPVEPPFSPALLWLSPVVVGCTLAFLCLMAGLLVYSNGAAIRAVNDDTLLKYTQFVSKELPPQGAILLCDSDDPAQDQPVRAYLVQAMLAHQGQSAKYPVVDTKSLDWPPYHHFLYKRFPQVWPKTVTTNESRSLTPLQIFVLLNQLSKSNAICYLNPSFGYFFEEFYQQPRGLVYPMKLFADNTLLSPPLDQDLITENEEFWADVFNRTHAAIDAASFPHRPNYKHDGMGGWFLQHLHIIPEGNPNALMIATFYSRCMNYLGVQLQRAGQLDQAAILFNEASEFNSNNIPAAVNLAFNKELRLGSAPPVDLARVTPDQFGKSRNWNEVLAANGPFDETSFCFANGVWFMQPVPPLLHQAANQFARVRQLAPDNLAARLFLAQIYVAYRQPDKALEVLHDPLTRPTRFALTEYNSTELSVLAAAAYFQTNENAKAVNLLETEMNRHPDDETLLAVSFRVYNGRGLYADALHTADRKLARSPNDLTWLSAKGMVSLQVSNYTEAVSVLTKYLALDTNNPDALYSRAFAYYQNNQLDAAQADFQRVQAAHTNSFQLGFWLGEIARRHHQTNEAIRNYQIFIANAPTNSLELQKVRNYLNELNAK